MKRFSARLQVLELGEHRLPARVERVVLLHGDGVDRSEIGQTLAQLVRALDGGLAVVERRRFECSLDGHTELLDDASHRGVHLYLKLPVLDAKIARRGELRLHHGLCVSHCFLRVVDGRSQRLRIRGFEVRPVAEPLGPVLRALLQGVVELVHRLDALAQQFERFRTLAGGAHRLFQLCEFGTDGHDLALEMHLSLRDGRDLDLARREALVGGGLLAELRVAGFSGASGVLLESIDRRLCVSDALRKRLELRGFLARAFANVGDPAGDAIGLGVECRHELLEPAELLPE